MAKNFILEKENKEEKISEQDIIKITHAALFLSCKIRERDIHCPMVPHVLNAGEHIIEEKDLRGMELSLSQFYDWNLSMMTYYDFLEQFMHMGLTFATDTVKIKQKETSATEVVEKEKKSERKNSGDGDASTQRGSPEDQRNGERWTIMRLGDMDTKERDQILDKIERRCLDLAKQICQKFTSDATVQREVAYLIVSTARREAGIIDYDSDLIKEFYKMEIRDSNELNRISKLLSTECEDNSKTLKFDLVVRFYTPDGMEMIPPPIMEVLQEEGKKIRAAMEKKYGPMPDFMGGPPPNEQDQRMAQGPTPPQHQQQRPPQGMNLNQRKPIQQTKQFFNNQRGNNNQVNRNNLRFHPHVQNNNKNNKNFQQPKLLKFNSDQKPKQQTNTLSKNQLMGNKTSQGFFNRANTTTTSDNNRIHIDARKGVTRTQTSNFSNQNQKNNIIRGSNYSNFRPSVSFSNLNLSSNRPQTSQGNFRNMIKIDGRPGSSGGNMMRNNLSFNNRVSNIFFNIFIGRPSTRSYSADPLGSKLPAIK